MKFKIRIVTKYVLLEFIPTFVITFSFFFLIFIINHILLYIKPLFEKDVPLDLIGMLLLTALPMYMLFCFPFGVMLATLMTMGRFSSDNEIVAFRALGFNIMEIFGPVFIIGIVVTFLSFYINDRVLPYSLQEQRTTLRKIMYLKPTLDFKSKTVKNYFGKILITDIVKNTSIDGLIIIDKDERDQKKIITTKRADILVPKERKNSIEIKMNDAMVQFENKDRQNEFNYGYSDSISYFISFEEEDNENSNVSGNEKTTYEIYQEVNKSKETALDVLRRRDFSVLKTKEETRSFLFESEQYLKGNISNTDYNDNLRKIGNNLAELKKVYTKKDIFKQFNFNLIELYRKFALPLACIIFTIFAAPIGVYSKRAGKSIGFILGLFLCA
ncbi:MAG TPA: LptF/LptG family permease, partial [Spirochaetota bacterium]|nr:LptF/LptG family permease [Spirochaetota bacterium]